MSETPDDILSLCDELKLLSAIMDAEDRDAPVALIERAIAMLYSARLRQGGVPEGWKLVPEEPTAAMLNAGAFAKYDDGHEYVGHTAAMTCWPAMLSSTPLPPGGEGEGCWTPEMKRAAMADARRVCDLTAALTLIADGRERKMPDGTTEMWDIEDAAEVARAALMAVSPPLSAAPQSEDSIQATAEPAASDGSVIEPVCQWKPIETAPEGKKVLVSARLGEHRHTMTARFWPTGTLQVEDELPGAEEIDGELCMPAGWYEENHGDETWINQIKPTHWMPLPPSPDDRTDTSGALDTCLKQTLSDALRARVERLEGALRRIAENPLPDPVFGGRPDLGVPAYEGSRTIARAALDTGQETET